MLGKTEGRSSHGVCAGSMGGLGKLGFGRGEELWPSCNVT